MTMLTTAAMLVCERDGTLDAPCGRWFGEAAAPDLSVIERARSPALDVGCGPGRHVVALAEHGVSAMGIDVTPSALDAARWRGAPVLERSVFDRVPGAGRWASALLLDGNIGLGGDPIALLRRVASLVRPDGVLLVELDSPGTTATARHVRFEIDGSTGPWFSLATVAADHLDDVSRRADLVTTERWVVGGRWFASLGKPAP